MSTLICPHPEQLKDFYGGLISETEQEEMLLHVSGCPHCQNAMERLEDAQDLLIRQLRTSASDMECYENEPACELGIARALGALASLTEDEQAVRRHSENDIPQSIGDYEVLRLLGSGGMGRVFLARHRKLGRLVAVKVLANHRLGDHRARQRFETEMRAVGGLSHPNIVIAHDAREIDDQAVLVTEYIDGLDLGQLIQSVGPLPLADACEIIRQAAKALQYTAAAGFVHRDIKPSNLMLSRNGEVKLLDLGLARIPYAENVGHEVTYTGQTLGTADYISPEQVTDSRHVDVRSDIYSLGATFTKLLTGNAPFADENHITVFSKLTAHVSEVPKNVGARRSDIPAEIDRLISAMLSKRTEDRPQHPQVISQKLEPFCAGSDLAQLAMRALELPPISALPSALAGTNRPHLETHRAHTKRTRRGAMIGAGFLGFCLGLFFGIVITITHRDGTKSTLSLPSGTKVEIAESSDDVRVSGDRTSTPANLGATVDSTLATASAPPLELALLVEREASGKRPTISDENLQHLQDILHKSGSDSVIQTEDMRFVPVATWMDGQTPITAWNNGVRYALVSTSPAHSLNWQDISSKILECESTHDVATGRGTLKLTFDDELGERLGEVTAQGIGLQLGILIDGLLVQAPVVNKALGAQVVISGNFSARQMQSLRHVLDASQSGSSTVVKTARLPDRPMIKLYNLKYVRAADAYQILAQQLHKIPGVRMESDERTNTLIVSATRDVQQDVANQLRVIDSTTSARSDQQFEVIDLKIDTQSAISLIKKFFDNVDAENPEAPIVDGDIGKRKLYVKGTAEQLEKIIQLLEKISQDNQSKPLKKE